MLRNLMHEIVRRRLWPIPALALLVALAAPVLFLKSAPAGAPAADTAAPPAAAPGKLPARAERLLAATGQVASPGGAKGSARDPFAPPTSRVAAAATGASASGAAGAKAASGTTSPASSDTPSAATPSADPSASTVTDAPSSSGAGPADSSALAASNASVDVRFGPRKDARVHRAIPRLQPYFIHGKLAAVFVKYSPTRHKAVFAMAPGLLVRGPVKCRRVEGVCRYLDIPAGSYARLTMLTSDRILVTRRLDVVAIGSRGSSATTATAASDHGENACLLNRLVATKAGGSSIDRDACER